MFELCYETINRSPFVTPGFEADLPAQFAAAQAAGFSHIGLDRPSIDQAVAGGLSLRRLVALLEDHELACLELQPLIVTPDEAATARDAVRFAQLARALGSPWVQCGLAGAVSPEIIASFRRAAAIVSEGGAALAVEYLPFASLRSIADTRRFLADAKVPSARIVVDTWHFFHGPEDWDALEELQPDELAYPQFNDHAALASDDLMHETMQCRVLPGQGRFDLARFAKTVSDSGYRGPISVEILSAELRESAPQDFAKAVFDAAAPYWSETSCAPHAT